MVLTLLPDRVVVCPVFQVMVIVTGWAPSRRAQVASGDRPATVDTPAVSSGCVGAMHGPYWREMENCDGCGELVSGGLNRRLALLGGVQVSSVPAAAASAVLNGMGP